MLEEPGGDALGFWQRQAPPGWFLNFASLAPFAPDSPKPVSSPGERLARRGFFMRTPKLTIEEFILKAQEVHGDRYDYSETEYLGSVTPLKIRCKEHGEFFQLPYVHLRGSGCQKCISAARITEGGWALLEKLHERHGDRYDLSKIVYTGVREPVTLGCAEHGDFSLTPMSLLAGNGCPKCGITSRAKKVSERTGWALSTDEAVAKCKATHGQRYDYSKAEFKGRDKKIEIVCRQHGPFWQRVIDHVKGQGCPICGDVSSRRGRTYDNKKFIEKVKPQFKAKYDLTGTNYVKWGVPVTLTCPVHGDFTALPKRLIDGKSDNLCPECQKAARPMTQGEFLAKAESVHGARYDYSAATYKMAHDLVTIRCRIHGDFAQKAYQHLAGHGCIKCNQGIGAVKRVENAADGFADRASAIHNGRYSYTKVEYVGVRDPVIVTCPDHGDFLVSPGAHLHGAACRKCAWGNSSAERELSNYLSDIGVPHELRDRTVIRPKELDISVPGCKVAIEYCGLYWHRSDNPSDRQWSDAGIKPASYHLEKLLACEAAGYRLITIFEDEWLESADIVKTLLSRGLLRESLTRVGARQCNVVSVPPPLAREFYAGNHLQGFAGAKYHLGLEYGGELLAVGSFSTPRAIFGGPKVPNEYELVRFAQKGGIIVLGAMAKILAAFAKVAPEASAVISYVDRRWFTGATYLKAGFTLSHTSQPGYWYTLGQARMSRFAFAKHRLEGKLKVYNPELSERENMLANGYSVIYDCGHLKLVKAL